MTIYGIDYLAGARYKRSILKSHPNGWAAGFFAETFGDAFPVVDNLLKTGKCPLVRIQLLWEDSHKFGDKHINKIKALSRKCQILANRYPSVDVRISPFCEYDNSVSDVDKYLDICQLEAPNCTIVATPWTGKPSRKYINESHGNHPLEPGRCMYSVDGGYPRKPEGYDDIVDKNVTDLIAKLSRAEVFMFWHSRCNLRYRSKDTADRKLRIKQAKQRSPSPDFLKSLSYLTTGKGQTSIPKNTTIKSHADRHDAKDNKGDKFLIIYPKKVKEIVLKRGSKVVAKLPYYGPFEDGRSRYYSSSMGWKLGVVDIYVNGKKVGSCNCGFRDGDTR